MVGPPDRACCPITVRRRLRRVAAFFHGDGLSVLGTWEKRIARSVTGSRVAVTTS